MADQGQLTIDKVVPALMSQLGALQGEFASMPQTVSGSLQKVTNSFMAWVGGVNQATVLPMRCLAALIVLPRRLIHLPHQQ
jgi:phage-related minor tail protein